MLSEHKGEIYGEKEWKKEMKHYGHFSYIQSIDGGQGAIEQRFDEKGLMDVSATRGAKDIK
ncbi:MAG: hypothetical protein N2V77_02585 [Canidatus Methanoxibalbensis ujae]|nr:hypothetical protein [Candidatus Methanoxibalbensis ujae]